MDPNSQHQIWSRWTTTIRVPFHVGHLAEPFAQEMRSSTARVYRQLFGSVTELKITHEARLDERQSRFEVDCRTEGAPVPDPTYRQRQMDAIAEFFGKNLRRYGKVDVQIDVTVEAGDVGDGKPAAQLILGPPVALLPRVLVGGQQGR